NGSSSPAGTALQCYWFGGFEEKTVLMLFLVGCAQYLSLQFDQSTVQRWCTARTAADARRSMYILGFGAVPVWALFQLIGVALFLFFLHNPDPFATGVLNGVYKAERILPHFIMTHLSGGLAGLVIAGAFAAGMSTLSSCINVSSMVSIDDLYRKYINRDASDTRRLVLGKLTSLGFALAMTGGALLIYSIKMVTLTDFMLMAGAILTVGIPSVFIAGMFTRRIGTAAIWCGVSVAISFTIWVMLSSAGRIPASLSISIPPYYLAIFGNLLALGTALLASLVFKRTERNLTNLTVWDQSGEPLE
ncbi:MAG: sodium transporter, partial [Verrucomicrobiota bacterium]